jgi:TatA/E family protein of Tat protein translocase
VGIYEILIVGSVVLLIFGGSRIPGLLKAMGEAKAGYKRAIEGKDDADAEIIDK